MATYLIGNVKGPKGEDGYSPKASVEKTSNGAVITIEDKSGITSAFIRDGVDADGNNIDLTPYATKVEVQSQIEDLADTYATKEELEDINIPVTTVNGMTGDVVITPPDLTGYATQEWIQQQGYMTSAPVESVNGKTGAAVLNAADVGALPDSTVIPTKVSDLTNDSNFVSNATLNSLLQGKQDALTAGTNITISNGVISASGGSSFSGDYDDLTNKPDLSVYAESADLATVATTGDYTDLTNTPTIPTVPTNVSDFTNDAGYITSADLPSDELPAITTGDAGKVLAVNSNEDGVEWATPASGGGSGTTYTAGNGIEIDSNNVIKTASFNPLSSAMWLFSTNPSFTGVSKFGASSTWEEFTTALKAGKICYVNTSTSYTFNNDYKLNAALFGIDKLYAMNLEALSIPMMSVSIPEYSATGIQVSFSTYYQFDGTTLWSWTDPEQFGNYIKVRYKNNKNYALGKALQDINTDIAAKQDALTAGTGIDITNGVISATGGSGGGSGTIYTAGDGIEIDRDNVITNTAPYNAKDMILDMYDATGIGLDYIDIDCNGWEYSERDNIISSVSRPRNIDLDTFKENLYVEEDVEDGLTYELVFDSREESNIDDVDYSISTWSDGNIVLTNKHNLTTGRWKSTVISNFTFSNPNRISVLFYQAQPIPREYLTDLPVDGQTIGLNKDGQLEVISSVALVAGNGIQVSGSEISIDDRVVPTVANMNNALATKQNTLTAGNGIGITNNIVTATGTWEFPSGLGKSKIEIFNDGIKTYQYDVDTGDAKRYSASLSSIDGSITSKDNANGITKLISLSGGDTLVGYNIDENNNQNYSSRISYRGNSGWHIGSDPIMVKKTNLFGNSQEAIQLKSPNGTVFNITVDDSGNLSAVAAQ